MLCCVCSAAVREGWPRTPLSVTKTGPPRQHGTARPLRPHRPSLPLRSWPIGPCDSQICSLSAYRECSKRQRGFPPLCLYRNLITLDTEPPSTWSPNTRTSKRQVQPAPCWVVRKTLYQPPSPLWSHDSLKGSCQSSYVTDQGTEVVR